MKNQKAYRLFLWCLSVLGVLTFIFANSLMPSKASGGQSGSLFSFLKEFFPFLTHHIVRKLAHFCEYALLGVHLAFAPALLSIKARLSYAIAFLFGGVIALLDEGVQYFVPGRVSAITDVLIDYAGYLTALLFVFFMCYLFAKYRKENPLHAKA